MTLLAMIFLRMPSSHTLGERIAKRSPSKTWWRVRARLAMPRSGFAENKLLAMAYNTFGWTHVASINQVVPNSRRPSIPCFAGTMMQLNATYTCQMFRHEIMISTISSPGSSGNWHFEKVDGLLGVGRFKSSFLRHQLSA